MIRHRALELLLYGTGPLAIFITAPILARGLGPIGRGELGVAQSVASFALALGALGQAEVLLADRRTRNGDLRVSGRISMLGGTISAVIAAIILIAVHVDFTVAIAAVVLIPILSQSQLWRAVAVSNQELKAPAMNNFVAALLRVVLLSLLVFSPYFAVSTGMLAIQLSTALAAIITMRQLARRNSHVLSVVSEPKKYHKNLVRGLPIVAFGILTSITLGSSVVVLHMYSDPVSVGVYSAASSLSMAVLSVSGAFKSRAQAAVFLPNSQKRVRHELIIVLGLGSIGAITAIAIAPWIVHILLGPGFESATPLLRVLAISCVGLLALDSVHGLLAAMGLRKIMILVGAVGAFTTVFSLLVLVPALGAMGAALSSVFSYSITGFVGWLIVRSRLN